MKFQTIDDIKIKDKKFKFKLPKKERRHKFPFSEPTPVEMRTISLDELYSVNIQWKMLTFLRPKSKVDEEYFSRYTHNQWRQEPTQGPVQHVICDSPTTIVLGGLNFNNIFKRTFFFAQPAQKAEWAPRYYFDEALSYHIDCTPLAPPLPIIVSNLICELGLTYLIIVTLII